MHPTGLEAPLVSWNHLSQLLWINQKLEITSFCWDSNGSACLGMDWNALNWVGLSCNAWVCSGMAWNGIKWNASVCIRMP